MDAKEKEIMIKKSLRKLGYLEGICEAYQIIKKIQKKYGDDIDICMVLAPLAKIITEFEISDYLPKKKDDAI